MITILTCIFIRMYFSIFHIVLVIFVYHMINMLLYIA